MTLQPWRPEDWPSPYPPDKSASTERVPCEMEYVSMRPCTPDVKHDVLLWYPTLPDLGKRQACFEHATAFLLRNKAAACGPIERGSAIRVHAHVEEIETGKSPNANRGHW